ncbi:hypothetical protein N7478_008789 [Penicillium angulare]|uniref:uncharacterized protein n=1 Tax=Penicillium angulare TaxID=116970 RepID=UPI00253FBD36|nr:uncharacterized protein N7478_008789 [Penicillium angulare]KAJ5273664.1 hypothetical protein N7478_008789 [Penicillium angulare]
MSAKLAWVDSPTNPWRNIIIPLAWGSKMVLDAVLALSSEDLAAKLQHDHPHHRHFQDASLRLRNQALISLSNQIALMSQETSLTRLEPSQAQQALASALILYNVELLGAESVKWRMHLQAARAIFQWKKQRFPREALTDQTDSFLLYEQYYASVFAGLTTFDTPGEPLDDIQYTDTTAFFGDFVHIINRATQIERIDYDQKYEIHPSLITSMVQEVDEAKHCMVASSQMLHFPDQDARVSFHRLVCIFHDATLIYIHQALSKHCPPEVDVQYLRDSILDNSASLSGKISFAQDLIWPLFIAGTECQGFPDKQEIVARDIEVVMRISGTLDRRKVLDFLRHFWSLGPESSVSWIQLMRTQAPNYHMLIL